MTHHETRTLSSGTVLHRWHPDGEPRGLVVLQHGFGEHAQRYVDLHHGLVGHLLRQQVQVWAADLWGHGVSPGHRGRTHVGRAVADHQEVLQQASRCRVPVVAFGHSLGGLVTAASVAVNPHGLVAVILTGPALPVALPAVGRRLLGLAARVAPGVPIPQRRRPLTELGRASGLVEATTTDTLMYDGQVPLLLAATALDEAAKLREAALGWTVPLLVLHGTADTYTDPVASAALVATVGPPAQLHLVQDGYHELLEDVDRDIVLARVLEFINVRIS